MEKAITGGAVIIGLALVGLWFFYSGNNAPAQTETNAYDTAASQESTAADLSSSAGSGQAGSGQTTTNQQKIMQSTLHTNKGDITIKFLGSDAPNTVANFTKLASAGFYDGTKFHRVIKGFMIQGGDPLTKDDSLAARWGTGGPGYQFADEIHANNINAAGTIAMANAGPNTNGSQFFINVAANNFLDTKHTVFGKVTSGMDVVTQIENTPTASDRPVSAVIIESITLK